MIGLWPKYHKIVACQCALQFENDNFGSRLITITMGGVGALAPSAKIGLVSICDHAEDLYC